MFHHLPGENIAANQATLALGIAKILLPDINVVHEMVDDVRISRLVVPEHLRQSEASILDLRPINNFSFFKPDEVVQTTTKFGLLHRAR